MPSLTKVGFGPVMPPGPIRCHHTGRRSPSPTHQPASAGLVGLVQYTPPIYGFRVRPLGKICSLMSVPGDVLNVRHRAVLLFLNHTRSLLSLDYSSSFAQQSAWVEDIEDDHGEQDHGTIQSDCDRASVNRRGRGNGPDSLK